MLKHRVVKGNGEVYFKTMIRLETHPFITVLYFYRFFNPYKFLRCSLFYDTRFLGVNLKNPSWAEVARSLGAEGVTIDNLGGVGEALDKACDAQKRGKTTVIEVMVTQELGDPFRRDALKYPSRTLEKYKHTDVTAPG